MKAGHAKAWPVFLKISYDDSNEITGKIMQIIFLQMVALRQAIIRMRLHMSIRTKTTIRKTFGRRYFDQTTSVMRDEVEKLVETPSQIA